MLTKEVFLQNYSKEKYDFIIRVLNNLQNIYDEHLEKVNQILNKYSSYSENDRCKLIEDELKELNAYQIDIVQRSILKKVLTFISYSYSVQGVRLEKLYNMKQLQNGSADYIKISIFNVMKLQICSLYDWVKDLTDEQFNYLCYCIVLKLTHKLNNTITYNWIDNTNRYFPIKRYTYKPIDKNTIDQMIQQLKMCIELKKFDIREPNTKSIIASLKVDYKKENNNHMRKYSKEQLEGVIRRFSELNNYKPTLTEMCIAINNYVLTSNITDKENYMFKSETSLKYYIQLYELQDSVNMRVRRTKEEIMREKEEKEAKKRDKVNKTVGL